MEVPELCAFRQIIRQNLKVMWFTFKLIMIYFIKKEILTFLAFIGSKPVESLTMHANAEQFAMKANQLHDTQFFHKIIFHPLLQYSAFCKTIFFQ